MKAEITIDSHGMGATGTIAINGVDITSAVKRFQLTGDCQEATRLHLELLPADLQLVVNGEVVISKTVASK